MSEKCLGVIGGSGLYHMEGLEQVETVTLKTPFGDPSDAFLVGRLEGVKFVFLPRHGKGHRIQPSALNFRANIYGMKKLGVQWIIGVSAVGSLRESIQPGDMVIFDQFIDQTKGRPSTFFDNGMVGHISFADPICPVLSRILYETGKKAGANVHHGGTYLCIEGPQFSTRAESKLYRSWGADIVGMTNLPEAKLAREAEICYSTIAFPTDYDCWRDNAEDISTAEILKVLSQSTKVAKEVIRQSIQHLPEKRDCGCAHALKQAMVTPRKYIPKKTLEDLEPIIGKYMKTS